MYELIDETLKNKPYNTIVDTKEKLKDKILKH